MARTYVAVDPETKPRIMVLTCSRCDTFLRTKVSPLPDQWPLHRCGHNSTIIRPFDHGEEAKVR
jgi:hypothetical protein